MGLDFNKMSTETLFSIWKNTNAYRWDEALGPKPEGFDDMPDRRGWRFWIKETKDDYTGPIFNVVNRLIPYATLEILLLEEDTDLQKLSHILYKSNPGIKTKRFEKILRHFFKNETPEADANNRIRFKLEVDRKKVFQDIIESNPPESNRDMREEDPEL